jgi:uncharacterized protein
MPPVPNSHDPSLIDTEGAIETDAGPGAGGKSAREKQRRCIATMESGDPQGMVRFVLSPAGVVTPDLAARLPGRGAWVTARREAFEAAAKKNAFSRAFRTPANLPADLPELVERLLTARVLDMLGMAKRAGDLILGFEQVREWMRSQRPACLIEASDGSLDGRGKLLALIRAVHGREGAEPPVMACFSADELGMALGRERVIHACLKQGRIAKAWVGELTRLAGFRHVWLGAEDKVSGADAGLSGPEASPPQGTAPGNGKLT